MKYSSADSTQIVALSNELLCQVEFPALHSNNLKFNKCIKNVNTKYMKFTV